MVEARNTILIDCRPTEQELTAILLVCKEVRGRLLRTRGVWSLSCARADDVEFAAMRLATDLDGVVGEGDGGLVRVDLGPDRSVVLAPTRGRQGLVEGEMEIDMRRGDERRAVRDGASVRHLRRGRGDEGRSL